jgi:hypothetical protein
MQLALLTMLSTAPFVPPNTAADNLFGSLFVPSVPLSASIRSPPNVGSTAAPRFDGGRSRWGAPTRDMERLRIFVDWRQYGCGGNVREVARLESRPPRPSARDLPRAWPSGRGDFFCRGERAAPTPSEPRLRPGWRAGNISCVKWVMMAMYKGELARQDVPYPIKGVTDNL